jgi:hypothetical protein
MRGGAGDARRAPTFTLGSCDPVLPKKDDMLCHRLKKRGRIHDVHQVLSFGGGAKSSLMHGITCFAAAPSSCKAAEGSLHGRSPRNSY